MSFRLTLGFAGLCLFVPELGDDGRAKRMHVLFPWTGSNDRSNPHRHEVRLICDRLPRGRQVSSLPSLPLAGRILDFSGIASNSPLSPPLDSIADLSGICKPAPRDWIADPYTGRDIVARVSFDAGEAIDVPCGRGARWDFRGVVRKLPIRVKWRMKVDNPELVLDLKSLDGLSEARKRCLKPDDKKITIWIFHSPSAMIPTRYPILTSRKHPPAGENQHFRAFLQALGCSSAVGPVFKAPEHPPGKFPKCYAKDQAGRGLDLMCIGARAPLEP